MIACTVFFSIYTCHNRRVSSLVLSHFKLQDILTFLNCFYGKLFPLLASCYFHVYISIFRVYKAQRSVFSQSI
jgi:hypothetical protein